MRRFTDRLVAAGWVDNLVNDGTSQPTIQWSVGSKPGDHGKAKLWLFSKLYGELLTGGPVTLEELEQLRQMGWAMGVQEGWEKV